MQVTVDIPDEFFQQILPAGQEPSRALLEDAALKAFCEGRLTAHELRVILGFETRYQLAGFLKERGVDHGSYGPDELEEDVRTVDNRTGAVVRAIERPWQVVTTPRHHLGVT